MGQSLSVIVLDQRGYKILPVLNIVRRHSAGRARAARTGRPRRSSGCQSDRQVGRVGRGVHEPVLLGGGNITVKEAEVETAPRFFDPAPCELLMSKGSDHHLRIVAADGGRRKEGCRNGVILLIRLNA